MQRTEWPWVVLMMFVALLADGCSDKEGDKETNGKTGGRAAPKVKLVKLDLTSAGLPLTIEAPQGTTAAKRDIGDVEVKKDKTFELIISEDPIDIGEHRKFAQENDVVKLNRFLIDSADTLFYEGRCFGTTQYHFVTNVEAGGKTYSVKPGAVPPTSKAHMERMLKCARTLAAKPAAEAPGPKDVALAIWHAMARGDGEAAAAQYECSEDDKAFLKKITPIAAKMSAFANAGIKAYGPETWLAAAKKAEMEDLAKPSIPTLEGAEKKIRCKVEGDKATCTLAGGADPIVLARKAGVWRAVPGDLPPKDKRDAMLGPMSTMAKAMESVQRKIGRPGVTAEKVFEALAQALAKEIDGGE